ERPNINDTESCPLVYLFCHRQSFRRVCRRARVSRRRTIPSRLPARRSQRVPRVFGSALADVNLVPPLLEHDNQSDGGWVDLRAPDSRRIRMALAAIGRSASPNKHLLLMAHTLAVPRQNSDLQQTLNFPLCSLSFLHD